MSATRTSCFVTISRRRPATPRPLEKLDPENPDKVPRLPDAIFVPSPQDVVEKMLELAKVKKEDVVVDLGCGDGRIPGDRCQKVRLQVHRL